MQGLLRERAVELSVVWQRGVENYCHFFIAVENKVGSTGLGLCARARLRVLVEPRAGLGTATGSITPLKAVHESHLPIEEHASELGGLPRAWIIKAVFFEGWLLIILFWRTLGILSSQNPALAKGGVEEKRPFWGEWRAGGVDGAGELLALMLFVCAGRGPEQAGSAALPSPHGPGGVLPEDPAGSAAGSTAGWDCSKDLSLFARRKEEDCSRAKCSPHRSSQAK